MASSSWTVGPGSDWPIPHTNAHAKHSGNTNEKPTILLAIFFMSIVPPWWAEYIVGMAHTGHTHSSIKPGFWLKQKYIRPTDKLSRKMRWARRQNSCCICRQNYR